MIVSNWTYHIFFGCYNSYLSEISMTRKGDDYESKPTPGRGVVSPHVRLAAGMMLAISLETYSTSGDAPNCQSTRQCVGKKPYVHY